MGEKIRDVIRKEERYKKKEKNEPKKCIWEAKSKLERYVKLRDYNYKYTP